MMPDAHDDQKGGDDLSPSCEHDYDHPRRIGRASYVCPKCEADISLAVILIAAAEEDHERLRQARKDIEGLGVPGRLPP